VGGLGIPNLTWKFLILCLRKRFLGKNIPMRVIVKELKKLAHGRISKLYNEDKYGQLVTTIIRGNCFLFIYSTHFIMQQVTNYEA
jgi:hypothetical protein